MEEGPPRLSKSWAIQTSHVPLFTGGKIISSRRGLRDDESNDEDPSYLPFLLLPVGGDLTVVDAEKGVRIGSVRGIDETILPVDDDEDDEVGIDAEAITAYDLARDDSLLVTCSHNSILRQYSISRSTKKLVSLTKNWGKSGHTLPVTEMAFHRSSAFLATGSIDGSARVWDARGGFVTHAFRPFQGGSGGGSGTLAVTALQWMPQAEKLFLAVARDDGSISLHDLRDREQKSVIILRDHMSSVTSMIWDRACQFFFTSGRDSVVNVWKVQEDSKDDSTTYLKSQTLPVYEQIEGMALLESPEEKRGLQLVTAGSKGLLRKWRLLSDKNRTSLELSCEQPQAFRFGEERGGYLQLVQAKNFDAQPLLVADAEHNINFISSTDDSLETIRTIVGHNDDILDIKVVPSESGISRVVVATNSPQVRVFDLETFSCHVLDRHTATVLCVDISPCGRFVATCGKDKQVRIWSLETMKCVGYGEGHTEAVGSVALSKKKGRYDVDGKAAENGGGAFVVTVSGDRTLKRWNFPGSKIVQMGEVQLTAFRSEQAHEKDINIVAVAPNDSLIASGSQDKTVKLWKATDLSLVATLKGHRRGVWDCQFSPFDRVVATASGDKSIKLWSLNDFSCVRSFQGHVSSVLRVRFINAGLQLISSGADGLIKLWTIRTNECESTMDGHSDKVWALDLSPDGKTLVSGGADSRINVWNDTTKDVEEAKYAEQEETLLVEQKLANHLRRKEYHEALEIALEREKPLHVLRIINSMLESEAGSGTNGVETLQKHAMKWSDTYIYRILHYCRDWNTRSRNCHVASLVVKAIVSTHSIEQLLDIEGIAEIAAGLVPYMERHFDRLDGLVTDSYLLDFALSSMGDLQEDMSIDQWEQRTKFVLPPSQNQGRFQAEEGQVVVGALSDEESSAVETVGESDYSDDD